MKRRAFIPTIVLAAALTLTSCGEVNVKVSVDTQSSADASATEDERNAPTEDAEQHVQEDTTDGNTSSESDGTSPADADASENADITYPSLPLPEFHYYGPEAWADYGDIICRYLIKTIYGDENDDQKLRMYAPIVVKVDDSDPKDIKVWGDFEIGSFGLVKTTLTNGGASSYFGVAHLDITGDAPVVTEMEFVEDGSGYEASFDRLFGKAGLKEEYSKATEKTDENITNALSYYIDHNGLYITQYQNYGWPAIAIPNAPETKEEDQLVDFTGNYGYTAKYDLREICSLVLDDSDIFSDVESDECNEFLIEICSFKGSNIDEAITELRSNLYDPSVALTKEVDIEFNGNKGCTRLSNDPPFADGDKVYVIYLIPRDGDILAVETSSDYSKDEEKQMYTDDLISNFLGSIELK